MKKKQTTVSEYKNTTNAYTIIVNNARYHTNFFTNIEKIIEYFLVDGEMFFGFYRTDGVNLTFKQQKKLEKVISAFFQKNGNIENLSEYLAVARIDSKNYDQCPVLSIFDYYLETVIFNPQVDWETFKAYQSNYQAHRFDDIINNNLAEVLFFYFDSGDFLICFNSKKYDPCEVRGVIEKFWGQGDGSVVP